MFKLAAKSILMICVPDFAKQGKKLVHFTRGKKKEKTQPQAFPPAL